ncbi:alpha/beta hydrolase [Austwickia chelonae]|uniref:alpha/beta hydrolase n=1 Tax=Austwickia chelonae TaxID=100225 RepID=UPI000E254909|nr:alpha/beta hydrolase [Austwickia chelonae]
MRAAIAVLAASAVTFTMLPAVSYAAPTPAAGPGQKTTSPASVPDMSKVKTPTLKWGPCEDDKTLQCATALLPVDYAKPDGPKFAISVAKKAATGKEKKGSIFINPGGPGESGSAKLPKMANALGKTVGEQYDIIGVDPRGVYPSPLAICWSKKPEPASSAGNFPVEPKDEKVRIAHDDYQRAACSESGRPLIDHMSTASTVRDHEMVRRALGDKQFNYFGVSYGTYLGATYAALFPNTVGRMVVDSVVDPVAWATGGKGQENHPVTARIHSGEGTLDTLESAIAECKKAGPKRCPEAPVIDKAWKESIDILRKGPVKHGDEVEYLADFLHRTTVSLYEAEMIPQAMTSIHDTWKLLTEKKKPTVTLKQTAEEAGKKSIVKPPLGFAPASEKPVEGSPSAPDDAKWTEKIQQIGVMCSDSVNPKDSKAWQKQANSPEAQKNPFLRMWTWVSSSCAGWPGQDKGVYRGPFTVKPANPLLILNNTHDPSTPMAGAKKLASLSPGSRLVTVDAWGHVSIDKSSCAAKAAQTYLLEGKLPAEGTTCKADKPLFPQK